VAQASSLCGQRASSPLIPQLIKVEPIQPQADGVHRMTLNLRFQVDP
jgi:hypothetical protein